MNEAEEVSDIALIIKRLSERQIAESKAAGFKPDEVNPKNVVLIVDEYDDPLLVNLDNDAAIGEVRKFLQTFYRSIKGCFKMRRFTLIAWITKFKQLSLFFGLNNVEDISLDSNYSTICGFSKDEIMLYHKDYISETLNHLKGKNAFGQDATDETLMEKILEWYDGYSWDGVSRVLTPYSIASLFKKMHFNYFWYLSGAPLFTSILTLKNDTYFKAFSKNFRLGNTLPPSDVHDINDEAALFQSGYLTIDSSDESSLIPQYILKVPNTEIGYAIVQEFVNKEGTLNNSKESINLKYGSFVDSFDTRDEKECSNLFSSCLAEMASHLHVHAELAPQVMMFTMLNVKEQRAKMEENVGGGRIDLVYISPSNDVAIVVIKYEKPWKLITPKKKQELQDKGVSIYFKQADEKRCAVSYFNNAKYVYVCALSIYGQSEAKIRFRRKVFVDGKIKDAPRKAPSKAARAGKP
jgi:hypothetical protein